MILKRKMRVAILFGGKSTEHEVSLQSAKNVFSAIDKEKYDVTMIGIDKSGRWLVQDVSQLSTDNREVGLLEITHDSPVALLLQDGGPLIIESGRSSLGKIDVMFPLLHGPYGEDGTVQGLLKLVGIPFVGPSILPSAMGMDKDVTKRILRDAGIPVGDFRVLHPEDVIDVDTILGELGVPVFVKPANLGSSVGVRKARNGGELEDAIEYAFGFDDKILVEAFMEGRELECAVLGDRNPMVSVVGEVVPKHEFYSYEAKYIDDQGASLIIPAKIDSGVADQVRELSARAFKALCGEGMAARVDFFMRKDGSVVVNEINTIPGFTQISMFPRLWQASGLSYGELIDHLIELSLKRFERESRLQTSITTR